MCVTVITLDALILKIMVWLFAKKECKLHHMFIQNMINRSVVVTQKRIEKAMLLMIAKYCHVSDGNYIFLIMPHIYVYFYIYYIPYLWADSNTFWSNLPVNQYVASPKTGRVYEIVRLAKELTQVLFRRISCWKNEVFLFLKRKVE